VYGPGAIKDIQRTLSAPETGQMDPGTVTHIKGLQHLFGLRATGIIDEQTAIQIQRLRDRYAIQE
jgi:peptidoglycan hydrolase-like protein with peptidoglycan-binding domain